MLDDVLSFLHNLKYKLLFGNLSYSKEIVLNKKHNFFVSRFGNVEFSFFSYCHLKYKSRFKFIFKLFPNYYPLGAFNRLRLNAGVCGLNVHNIKSFYDIYSSSICNIDYFFRWFSGDNLLCEYGFNGSVGHLDDLNIMEPGNIIKGLFQNSSVLVISSFSSSFYYQVQNNYKCVTRNMGISNATFHFITSPFDTNEDGDWFNNLDNIKIQIDELLLVHSVDYVVLGCGAYGLPLGSYCKSKGVSALHLGGVTQLLFCVKGKRWNDCGYYTSSWIEPLLEDVPIFSKDVEGGCYW